MARPGSEPHECGKATVLRRTDKAMLVELDDERQVWIPYACVHDDSEIYDGDNNGGVGMLVVPMWFAEQEGLE